MSSERPVPHYETSSASAHDSWGLEEASWPFQMAGIAIGFGIYPLAVATLWNWHLLEVFGGHQMSWREAFGLYLVIRLVSSGTAKQKITNGRVLGYLLAPLFAGLLGWLALV